MSTVTDVYGDTAEVYTNDGPNVYVDVVEDGTQAELSLHPDAAVELADALYEAAGEKPKSELTKPHPDAVLASDVSFNEAVLRLAAAHDRVAEFSYSKGDGGVIERRRLQPESIRQVKGHTTVIGFDPDRQNPRAYRLDRIVGEATL